LFRHWLRRRLLPRLMRQRILTHRPMRRHFHHLRRPFDSKKSYQGSQPTPLRARL
jgi:hypothetical protein